MNTAAHWDPFKEMEELQDRLGTYFGRPPLKTGKEQLERPATSPWRPQVNITEDAQEYVVKAELPELRREELTVTVEDGVLKLAGEWQRVQSDGGNPLRVQGSFVQSLVLPTGTDPATVTAEFDEGALRVHVPKTQQPQTKTMTLKVE